MAKGAWSGTLKDDLDFKAITLTPNQQVLLMGNADTISQLSTPISFIEDMTSEQKALKGNT